MATQNFFALLGDDENEDPAAVVARATSAVPTSGDNKTAAAAGGKKAAAPAKLPTKPAVPGADAVKDGQRGQYDGSRGGRGGRGEGRGRGGRGGGRGNYGDAPREGGGYRERSNYNNSGDRNVSNNKVADADGFVGGRATSHYDGGAGFGDKPRLENGEGRAYDGARGRGGRGGGRGGRSYDGEERPRRREFDRHSGSGRGNESLKRDGSGRGNWGSEVDAAVVQEVADAKEEVKTVEGEVDGKIPEKEAAVDVKAEDAVEEKKEEEEEDNEMTLEEYEKLLEEKRKALDAEKNEERKVEADKAFESMQLVDNKKREEDIFIKLGEDKEKVKKREAAEREERARKPVSINEFLKPAEGEKYYGPPSNRGRGGRGGRGERGERSERGSFGGGGRFGGGRGGASGGGSAPKIEDQMQFPTLGGK